jgi:L-threonylcarbamoyladenylate synthase
VVAIPTDTVYGLAADPFQPQAVERIFRLKGRPESKPMLLLVDSRRQVEMLVARLPPAFERVTVRYWPGPLTIVLPAGPAVPHWITAGTGTVAVRLPGSAMTREIIRAARVPLTGTSANRSGHPPARSAVQVQQAFPAELSLIVDGGPARCSAVSTLLAKVIAKGDTREQAIERLAEAISKTAIEGVRTNLGLFPRVLAHPTFRNGTHDTGFLVTELGYRV